MESKNIILVSGLLLTVIVIVAFAVFFIGDTISDGSKPAFGQGNHNNSDIVCDIIGYTNVIEARYNTSLPVPDYITEKYGEIYIPADVMVCDLVEFDDFGLKQDNSTTLLMRINDTKYSINLTYYLPEPRDETNNNIDYYFHKIEDSRNYGDGGVIIAQARSLTGEGLSYFMIDVNFQSEYRDGFGIYIIPVQATESAMKSPRLLYAIYSSDDINHDYMLPLPGE